MGGGECGSGATCMAGGPTGTGQCMRTCTTDADCRASEGYTCQPESTSLTPGGDGFGRGDAGVGLPSVCKPSGL